jgi:hypothetical protein
MARSMPLIPVWEWESVSVGAILPSQYFQGLHRASLDCGERRLMLALLVDAISCLLVRNDRRLQEQARLWLNGCCSAAVSFEQACEAVGLDADAMRAGLERLAQNRHRLVSCAYFKGKYRASG